MANSHKLTVQEAMNASGSGGGWSVQTVATHGGTSASDTIHVEVTDAHQIGVLCAGETYFRFSEGEESCSTSNDLSLPANTLVFLTVPKALGTKQVAQYFNHLGVAANEVRIVLV